MVEKAALHIDRQIAKGAGEVGTAHFLLLCIPRGNNLEKENEENSRKR